MSSVLFRDARLLDGTEAPPRHADVRVSGNRIVETASAGGLPVREGEDTISCRGATLMPGLIEPHAHLSFERRTGRVRRLGMTATAQAEGRQRVATRRLLRSY